MLKASEIVGMEVYTSEGKNIGRVFDLIINLPEARVERLSLEPLKPGSREEAQRIFREKTILFEKVEAVKEIIIVSSAPAQSVPIRRDPQAPHATEHTSYRHRFGHRKQ